MESAHKIELANITKEQRKFLLAYPDYGQD